MSVFADLKSTWTDGGTQEKWHLFLTGFFSVHIPVFVGIFILAPPVWRDISIIYLVLVSQWALVGTHWTGFEAARGARLSGEVSMTENPDKRSKKYQGRNDA